MINTDILQHIVEYLDFNVTTLLSLAQVNRLFYRFFTGDHVWRRYDVYNVKRGIYRHFLDSFSEHDKLGWAQVRNRPLVHASLLSILNSTLNKYLWLECFAADEYLATDYSHLVCLDLDRDFFKVAVRISPSLYLLCKGDLLNDKEIAFNSLTSPKSSLMNSGHFSEHSDLASDREFCKLIIDRPTREIRGNLGFFAPELTADLELLAIAFKWCPQAIFLAPQITQEVVDLLIPTEDAFLPVIEGYFYELWRFMWVYRSARVIRTAFNGCGDDEELAELEMEWGHELDPEAMAAVQAFQDPQIHQVPDMAMGLKPTMDTVLMALWSNKHYAEGTSILDVKGSLASVYNIMGPELQNNKELWYIFLRDLDNRTPTLTDSMRQLLHPSSPMRDSITAVLDDPEYATKLASKGCQWFNVIQGYQRSKETK